VLFFEWTQFAYFIQSTQTQPTSTVLKNKQDFSLKQSFIKKGKSQE